MKKAPAALLLIVMILVLCVSCNTAGEIAVSAPTVSEAAGEPRRPVLRMGHYLETMNAGRPYDVGMGELLRRFTEETGIEIELTCIPWDQIDRQLVVSNRAGEPGGDIYNLSSQRLTYLVNNGALLPLDDRLEESFPGDTLSANVLEAGTYSGDGKLYLILQSIHTRGLWYNRDYIQEPPATLEELVEVGLEVNRPEEGFYALAFWGGNHYGAVESVIAPLTWAYGGSLSEEDGRAAWNNEAVRQAVGFLSDCVNVHGITPESCLRTKDFSDIQELFSKGQFAMIFDGNYSYPINYFEPGNREKFGFAPYPGLDGPSSGFSNGWAWGIPRNPPSRISPGSLSNGLRGRRSRWSTPCWRAACPPAPPPTGRCPKRSRCLTALLITSAGTAGPWIPLSITRRAWRSWP